MVTEEKLDREETLIKWVKALRSGKYQQTKGRLKQKQGYCCLGVLCDTIDSKGWFNNLFDYKGSCEEVILPIEARKELRLRDNTINHLISMNDDEDFSFNEIADYIERYLLRKKVK